MATIWKKGPSWFLRPNRAPGEKGRPKAIRLGPIPDAAAERALKEHELRSALRSGAEQVPGLSSFDDALKGWLRDRRERRSPNTLRGYELHARHFRRLFPVRSRLGDLRPQHVARYMAARVGEGASRRTADKERITLGMVFRWARRRGLCESNPVEATEPYGDEVAEIPPANAALLAELLAELRAEARTFEVADRKWGARTDAAWIRDLTADVAEVAWWTALRLGEITRLTVAEVDLEAGTIPIRSARNKGRAKAFPIPPEVLPIFMRRCEGRDKGHAFGLEDGGDAYSSLSSFRQRWTRPEARRRFRAAFFHSLRHAYATDTEAADMHPLLAQRLTRHRTVQMLDHYSHRDLAALRAAQAQVSEIRRARSRPR